MIAQTQIQTDLRDFLRTGIFSESVAVAEDTDLVANGFDSLSLVALLQFIENKYGLWLPESEINEATLKNICTVAAVIVRLLHERSPAP